MTFELSGLTVAYGDVTVVRDVDLSVGSGSVTGLLGRNGAGKTSVLNAAVGLVPAVAGSVTLDGQDLSNVRPWNRVRAGLSMVQEGKRIFRSLTVDENLLLGAYGRRISRSRQGAYLDEIYDQVPMIASKRRDAAGSLSGGQQQMLAIGQALGARPSVLLLDEPSAGLAPAIVGDVFTLIDQLRSGGMAILLVEQSVDFALAIADEVVVLEVGRVVLETPASVEGARQLIADAYMGHSADAVALAVREDT